MAEDLYVVGLSLQTQQLQQGVQQATRGLQTLGQAEDKLTQQTKQAEQATQALGRSQATLGQSAGRATQGLTQQTNVLQTLGRGVQTVSGLWVTFGAYLGGQFVRSVTHTVTQMEGLRASFRAITGSAEGSQRELGFVAETAQRLGLDITTLAESYRGFAAASRGTTLEGQRSREVFTAISEASATLGLSSEQTGRALTALQQIMSKGKVSAEELRGQLGEALPGAFQIAARAMGVTTAKLDEMLVAGTLISDTFLPKFAAQVRKELGEASTQAAERAGAGMTRLWNVMKQVTGVTFAPVVKEVDRLAGSLATLATNIARLPGAFARERAQLGTLAGLSPEQQRALTPAEVERFATQRTEYLTADQIAAQNRRMADRVRLGFESAAGDFPFGGPSSGLLPDDPAKKRTDELTASLKQQTDASRRWRKSRARSTFPPYSAYASTPPSSARRFRRIPSVYASSRVSCARIKPLSRPPKRAWKKKRPSTPPLRRGRRHLSRMSNSSARNSNAPMRRSKPLKTASKLEKNS
jgi:tape measure domain-containing protein